jgi:hypothetical protein
MVRVVRLYAQAVFRQWFALVLTVAGIVGSVGTIYGQSLSVPRWAWEACAGVGLVVAQFRSWDDVRKERDELLGDEGESGEEFPACTVKADPTVFFDVGEERFLVFAVSITNREPATRMILEFEAALRFNIGSSVRSLGLLRDRGEQLKSDEFPHPTAIDPQASIDGYVVFRWYKQDSDTWLTFDEEDGTFQAGKRCWLELTLHDRLSMTDLTLLVPGRWPPPVVDEEGE